MELAQEAALAHDVIYNIMMFMGCAIGFSFFMIALAKQDLRHSRRSIEQDLKYLKESLQCDIKWLREENSQLRKQLLNLGQKD